MGWNVKRQERKFMKTSSLRVLSGQFRGTKLASPDYPSTHPMGAREKLALFNMLQPYLDGAKVLDVYAGSGALGIEALSRGVKEVVFVEQAPKVVKIIQKNLDQLGLSARVFAETSGRFAGRSEYRDFFGLIIADPPYDKIDFSEISSLVKLLSPGEILALSYPAHFNTPELPELELLSDRQYAGARIAIYRKISPPTTIDTN